MKELELDTRKMERLRKAIGLSQDEAATGAGMKGKQVWSNIVSGRQANVTLRTLGRIAGVLKCDPAELMKGRGKPR